MASGFLELGFVVIVAALLGIAMRMFRQPLILAYLATGLLFSALGLYSIAQHETFSIFSNLGVMLLLFLVGLEINYTSVKMVGKTSILLGLGQIAFTFGIGFFIALFFHFSYLAAAYIAIALTFSSTIIIVKLLSEKKDLNSLYGKISIGFLLVQDFVAILLIVVLSGVDNGGGINLVSVLATILKGVGVFAIMLWLGRKAIPHVFEKIGRSQELLFIISLAWVFVVAVIVQKIGFSIEIAGFLAGIGLANSYEHLQIASHMRPLRDFFILIFFVTLGASVTIFDFSGLGWPIVVFSLFVLIGNPVIVLILMGLTGYRRRTSFLTGITMAQVSEFSLILAALGLRLGHLDHRAVGLITAVAIVTIVISTYLILHADSIIKKIWHVLAIFEKLDPMSEDGFPISEFHKPIILVGAQRIGHIIASHLPKNDLLVIDFDPSVIDKFQKHGFTCIMGDIADRDIFEVANFDESRLVICTSPVFEDNMALLSQLKAMRGKRKVVLRADDDREAAILYKKGADYVIRPHLTSGHYIGEILGDPRERDKSLWRAREKDSEIIKSELL